MGINVKTKAALGFAERRSVVLYSLSLREKTERGHPLFLFGFSFFVRPSVRRITIESVGYASGRDVYFRAFIGFRGRFHVSPLPILIGRIWPFSVVTEWFPFLSAVLRGAFLVL